jgi:hypothetical protein
MKINIEKLKMTLEKLQLNPSDILLVKLTRRDGVPHAQEHNRMKQLHHELRKLIPTGYRSIVMFDEVGLEKLSMDQLAKLLTPEQVNALSVAMERRLLAQPAATLPMQAGKPKL